MSTNESVDFQLGCSLIERSDCEEILGVKIDYKLNFEEYVKTLCSKANNKLGVLEPFSKKCDIHCNKRYGCIKHAGNHIKVCNKYLKN